MNISSSKKPIILQFVGGKKLNHSNIKRTTKIGYKKARSFEIGLFLRLRRIGKFNDTHFWRAMCVNGGDAGTFGESKKKKARGAYVIELDIV